MSGKAAIAAPGMRGDYRYALEIPTRWADNDVYGHVNNVVYYAFFDTVVNRFLIDVGGLDIHNGSIVGIVAETGCKYYRPFAYPETVTVAMRVAHLGRSSVRYETALFGIGCDVARAEGFLVHVFVDRTTNTPVDIPPHIRTALQTLAR
jgi:acyl-CoA thioester hydrolase